MSNEYFYEQIDCEISQTNIVEETTNVASVDRHSELFYVNFSDSCLHLPQNKKVVSDNIQQINTDYAVGICAVLAFILLLLLC